MSRTKRRVAALAAFSSALLALVGFVWQELAPSEGRSELVAVMALLALVPVVPALAGLTAGTSPPLARLVRGVGLAGAGGFLALVALGAASSLWPAIPGPDPRLVVGALLLVPFSILGGHLAAVDRMPLSVSLLGAAAGMGWLVILGSGVLSMTAPEIVESLGPIWGLNAAVWAVVHPVWACALAVVLWPGGMVRPGPSRLLDA